MKQIEAFAGTRVEPCFVTELLPVARGISAAVFAAWTPEAGRMPDRLSRLEAAFREAYGQEPDVSVGGQAELASMKAVVGTNRFHLQIQEAYGRPVLFASIDNLLRGAAGRGPYERQPTRGTARARGVSYDSPHSSS